MEAIERDFVLMHLAESRARLLGTIAGLSAEQRNFRPAEDRWSVADCVEHIILVETFVYGNILQVLQGAPEPEKQPGVVPKTKRVLEGVPARTTRVQAPVFVKPSGRWEFEECLQQFETTRGRSATFAAATEADLKNHFFPHPVMGDLDCYQWLLFIGTHCERHVRQMEEVKADPGFPVRRSATA